MWPWEQTSLGRWSPPQSSRLGPLVNVFFSPIPDLYHFIFSPSTSSPGPQSGGPLRVWWFSMQLSLYSFAVISKNPSCLSHKHFSLWQPQTRLCFVLHLCWRMGSQSYSYSNPVLQIQIVGKGKPRCAIFTTWPLSCLWRTLAATDICLFNTRIKNHVKMGGKISSFTKALLKQMMHLVKCRWWKLRFAIICNKSISPSGHMHFYFNCSFQEKSY